jgi:hypothetical protein
MLTDGMLNALFNPEVCTKGEIIMLQFSQHRGLGYSSISLFGEFGYTICLLVFRCVKFRFVALNFVSVDFVSHFAGTFPVIQWTDSEINSSSYLINKRSSGDPFPPIWWMWTKDGHFPPFLVDGWIAWLTIHIIFIPLRIFRSHWDVTIVVEGLQILTYAHHFYVARPIVTRDLHF